MCGNSYLVVGVADIVEVAATLVVVEVFVIL